MDIIRITVKKSLLSCLLLASSVDAAVNARAIDDRLNTAIDKNKPNSATAALQLDYKIKTIDTPTHGINPDELTALSNSTVARLYLDLSYQLLEPPFISQAAETNNIASIALISRADEAIATITARRNPRLEAGFEKRDRSSTDGTSSYHGEEIPLVGWWPVGFDGHGFVRVDHVSIDAGKLPNNQDAFLFGKLGAKNFIPSAPISQRASGTSVAAGYVGDDLRWDLGVVGIGFPVQNFVGGIRQSGEIGKTDYALELSRRPQTSSLLSYAGARDPATGEVWGGVTNTAMSGRLAKNLGSIYTFASAEYGLLQGKNVLDNNRLALRIGADKDLIRQEDIWVNLGVTLSYWNFKENLSNYTFGHGGYYSPQRYTSLSIPIEWAGRKNKLSYLLRGSVSFSKSQEKDMNYYPTDDALQANSALGFSVYSGGSGGGTGYALRLAAEYQAIPNLAVGGRVEVERSAYYEPNTLFLYLKYELNPHQNAVSFPPIAVKPYSQF